MASPASKVGLRGKGATPLVARQRHRQRAIQSTAPALIFCLRPSTRPSLAVSGLDCRSAGRSLMHMADDCGRARICPVARYFHLMMSGHPEDASRRGAAPRRRPIQMAGDLSFAVVRSNDRCCRGANEVYAKQPGPYDPALSASVAGRPPFARGRARTRPASSA
jgi:hypothetical protein